jgi:hypothetical protein
MPTALEYAVDHLTSMHNMTLKTLDFPADKAAANLPGSENHCLWTLGHFASAYWYFGECIGAGISAPDENHRKLFGPGSKPVADASVYPPEKQLREVMTRNFDLFVARAKQLKESDLASPCPNGGGGFLKNQMEAILVLAHHEGWHSGQLASLRRGLGLPGVF